MTPRNTRPFRRALPLLIALPLVAQEVQVPAYRIDARGEAIAVTVQYPVPAAHVLLAAWSGSVVSIGGVEILANAVVLGVAPQTAMATFTVPISATAHVFALAGPRPFGAALGGYLPLADFPLAPK